MTPANQLTKPRRKTHLLRRHDVASAATSKEGIPLAIDKLTSHPYIHTLTQYITAYHKTGAAIEPDVERLGRIVNPPSRLILSRLISRIAITWVYRQEIFASAALTTQHSTAYIRISGNMINQPPPPPNPTLQGSSFFSSLFTLVVAGRPLGVFDPGKRGGMPRLSGEEESKSVVAQGGHHASPRLYMILHSVCMQVWDPPVCGGGEGGSQKLVTLYCPSTFLLCLLHTQRCNYVAAA